MLIKDIMKTNVIALPSHTSLIDAIHTFLTHGLSGAPVVNPDDNVIGIITEKDLLRAFYPSYQDYCNEPGNFLTHNMFFENIDEHKHQPISTLMNTRILIAKPDNQIRYLGGKMVATGIHQAPVVEDNKLIGIVTRRDIYRALLHEQFNINVYVNSYVPNNTHHA